MPSYPVVRCEAHATVATSDSEGRVHQSGELALISPRVSGDHTGHPSDRGVHTAFSVNSVGPARAPGYPLVLSSPGC